MNSRHRPRGGVHIVSGLVESFSRALGDLIDRRWRDFEKAFGDHVSTSEKVNRLGSGMDAHGRLEIARGTYKETVKEAMEKALMFSKTEGVGVAALRTAAEAPLATLAARIYARRAFHRTFARA